MKLVPQLFEYIDRLTNKIA